MLHALETIGYYRSPVGGALAPFRIPPGLLLFEMITDGAVYAPEGKDLHGVGWIFVHTPGQETIWRTNHGGHYACLTVRFNIAKVPQLNIWPRLFCWDHKAGAISFAHEMLHAFHHASLDRAVLGDYVWSQFRYRLDCFRGSKGSTEVPERIAAVIRFIEKHYGDPIGIDTMAAHVRLSASHLHVLFRAHVKMSPHQYLMRQRVQAARHLLVSGTQPIKAVARDVGYANTENFCRLFRQHTGMTAAAYRRHYQVYEARRSPVAVVSE